MMKDTIEVKRAGRPSVIGKGRERWWGLAALLLACLIPGAPVWAQIPIVGIIQGAVKEVIVATDLEVERLQTETIEAQNTEQLVENDMAQSELTGIAGWVQEQQSLFAEFYQELWMVKEALATYEEVKALIEREAQIVSGYRQVYAAISGDSHFSPSELTAMYKVLTGIVTESAQNIARLTTVVTSLVTQMGDGPRLAMIDETGRAIDANYTDLARFSQGAFLLSAQRAQGAGDLASIKALYNVP